MLTLTIIETANIFLFLQLFSKILQLNKNYTKLLLKKKKGCEKTVHNSCDHRIIGTLNRSSTNQSVQFKLRGTCTYVDYIWHSF